MSKQEAHYKNRFDIKKGDEVEVVDWSDNLNGLIGIVGVVGEVSYVKVTQPIWDYKVGSSFGMYRGNLRPVDQTHTFIPEDWS